MSHELALMLAYVGPLAVVAALLLPGLKKNHRAVVAVLVSLPLFYLLHVSLISALQGWPSNAPLPDEFRLIAFEVNEPNAQSRDPGEILIWARSDPEQAARVYRLPYAKSLHRSLVAAGNRQSNGHPQRGRRVALPPSSSNNGERGDGFHFEDERPPALPQKANATRAEQ